MTQLEKFELIQWHLVQQLYDKASTTSIDFETKEKELALIAWLSGQLESITIAIKCELATLKKDMSIIKEANQNEIALLKQNRLILAIKSFRERTGADLKTSKDVMVNARDVLNSTGW